MPHQRYFYVFLFTFLSVKCFSQTDVLPVSDDASKKIFFSVDYRNGFIRSDEAHIVGFRGGIEVDQRYRLGVGYHYLTSEVIRTIPVQAENDAIVNTNARVHLRYGSISA